MIPTLKLVGPSDRVQDRLAGLQAKVIRVVETEPASSFFQLLRRKSLEGCLSCHWHEDRQVDRSMRQMQSRCPCLGGLWYLSGNPALDRSTQMCTPSIEL